MIIICRSFGVQFISDGGITMNMKRFVCAFLSLVLLLGCIPAQAENTVLNLADDRYGTSEQVVAVTAAADVINTVKDGIFGANNGYRGGGYGIYDEENCVFNQDMLEMIRQSGITHIRQPGGIEGDYFHWYETVGPAEDRIPQINPFSSHYPTSAAKDGEPYDVVFGPDEWMELCKAVGIGLTIQLNAGNGTPQEAVDFIRYCLDRGVEIEASLWATRSACRRSVWRASLSPAILKSMLPSTTKCLP